MILYQQRSWPLFDQQQALGQTASANLSGLAMCELLMDASSLIVGSPLDSGDSLGRITP